MSNHKKPIPKGLLIGLSVFLGIVLVALIVVTVFANSFLSRINRVNGDEETLSDEQVEAILKETDPTEEGFEGDVLNPDDVELADTDLIEKSDEVVHIMLIGQDRRPNQGRTRSDAMILCTINKQKKTLMMTSFMRDTYVKIPDVNGKRYGKNRLNVPYALGGMDSLSECLVMNFGLEVDHMIEVDFSQFEQIVDAVGGVDIELTSSEAYRLGGGMKEGMNHLNGEKALAYARIRKIGGDFGRTNRQRTVLLAILDKVENLSLTEMMSLIDTIFPMITTNMTNADIVGYVMEFFPLLTDLQVSTQTAPMEGEYKGAMIDGMAVLVPDLEKVNARLKETIGS